MINNSQLLEISYQKFYCFISLNNVQLIKDNDIRQINHLFMLINYKRSIFSNHIIIKMINNNPDNPPTPPTQPPTQAPQKQCPYISTIKKNLLDFDFQKICSITLTHTNIYACLVCGRYFQGRSPNSPAYQHSIEFSHYVFINLQNSRIYCIPDDYEVDAYTIEDVKLNLRPVFSVDLLGRLEGMLEVEYNVDGREFVPGAMGMNNLGRTGFANTVIYLLNSIQQVRHFLVLNNDFQSDLLSQISTLLKKLWNPKSFKGIVSPHEFLQAVTDASSKKFKIGHQSDPSTFFLWLIDNLNKCIKKQKKSNKLDIQNLFRGKLKTSIIKGIKNSYQYQQIPSKIQQIPFTILKFQFPEKGVFNKTQSQITLQSLMQKYTGKVGEKYEEGLRYAKIIQFPSYLILVFKRFINNGYTIQKDNSCLLYGNKLNIKSNQTNAHYKLIAQVCHIGDYENGKYKVYFTIDSNQNPSESANEDAGKWFQIQDLLSSEIILKQVLLAQPYIQMYKLMRVVEDKSRNKQVSKQSDIQMQKSQQNVMRQDNTQQK